MGNSEDTSVVLDSQPHLGFGIFGMIEAAGIISSWPVNGGPGSHYQQGEYGMVERGRGDLDLPSLLPLAMYWNHRPQDLVLLCHHRLDIGHAEIASLLNGAAYRGRLHLPVRNSKPNQARFNHICKSRISCLLKGWPFPALDEEFFLAGIRENLRWKSGVEEGRHDLLPHAGMHRLGRFQRQLQRLVGGTVLHIICDPPGARVSG